MKNVKIPVKTVIGVNVKHLYKVLITGILLVLSLFLPFVSIHSEGISVNSFGIIKEVFAMIGAQGANPKLVIIALVLTVPPFFGLIASILAVFKTSVGNVRMSVVAYAINALSAVVIMFTCTKLINASGLLDVKFLVKYLGAGYWIYLAAGFAGLALSMICAKINPGYIVLVIMSIIWIFPILWVIMISFRGENGSYTSTFFPKTFTFKNYINLFADSTQFQYLRWFGNTLIVAVCSCVLSTFIVLSTAYTLSRIRFRARKPFMNLLLILGMFPGFMSMIAVYYILKGMGITQSLIALILVYAGGSAMGYYIAKGFFDTIPRALDEAAFLDGATKWQVFTKITIPLSKSIIIYTVLTSFMSPWADYIFAKVIMGDNYKNYTVALGLYMMLEESYIDTWYTRFAAGAVIISIPIAVLFIALQKYYVEGLSGSVKG